MSKENQEIEEIVEIEGEVEVIEEEEKKVPKGAIVAAIAAAGVGIGCGIKWLVGKLRDSRIDYVEIDDDDDYFEEEDSLEIDISEE